MDEYSTGNVSVSVVSQPTMGCCNTAKGRLIRSVSPRRRPDGWVKEIGATAQRPCQRNITIKKYDCITSLRPLVCLAGLFGVLPINYVGGTFRFKWSSLVTIYSLLVATVLTTYFGLRLTAFTFDQINPTNESKIHLVEHTQNVSILDSIQPKIIHSSVSRKKRSFVKPQASDYMDYINLFKTYNSFLKKSGLNPYQIVRTHPKGSRKVSPITKETPVIYEGVYTALIYPGSGILEKPITKQHEESDVLYSSGMTLGQSEKYQTKYNPCIKKLLKNPFIFPKYVKKNNELGKIQSFTGNFRSPRHIRSLPDEIKEDISMTSSLNEEVKPKNVAYLVQNCIFYFLGASGAVLLLRAARGMVELCERWCKVENSLGGDVVGNSRWLVLCVMIVMMVSAVGETTASMFYSVKGVPAFWRFLREYVAATHTETVSWLEYTPSLGISMLVINKYATFVWNFIDLFVGSIALVLSRHCRGYFNKLHKETNGGRLVMPASYWQVAREQHFALQELVEAADVVTGPLVLQSYLCNLFFMLVQLYYGLRPHSTNVVTRLHLLGRLLLVSLTCSNLHTYILRPLHLLLALPNQSLCPEVSRFLVQLQARPVGLSGCGYFLVNKSFILATAGALVTYEVILLQLNPASG